MFLLNTFLFIYVVIKPVNLVNQRYLCLIKQLVKNQSIDYHSEENS